MTSRFAHRPSAGAPSLSLSFALHALAVALGLLVLQAGEARAQSTPPEMVPIEPTQVLTVPDDVMNNNHFGSAVGISGTTLAVGAYNDLDSSDGRGAVYVFERSDGSWTFTQKIVVSDSTDLEYFGYSLAIDGDVLVVGSYYSPLRVFVRGDDGTWAEEAQLELEPSEPMAPFAVSGQTIVVGVPGDDESAENAGAARVFVRNGGVWSEEAKLLALDGAEDNSLGGSVAVYGDRVLVGAQYQDFEDVEGVGAAYVFERNGVDWEQQQKLLPSDLTESTHFGAGVSLTSDVAVVSASFNAYAAEDAAVYVYTPQAAGWAAPTIIPAPVDTTIGSRLASAPERLLVEGAYAVLYAHDGVDWIPQRLESYGAWMALTASDAVVAYAGSVNIYSIRRELGEPCNFGWMCESDTCVDNVCCDTACDGECETCAVTAGTCTTVVDADDEDSCAGGTCGPSGNCGFKNGDSCDGNAANCASGHCSDEVCCDTACDGGCDTCVSMTRGTCATVGTGYPGENPACAPYVCGASADCPESCTTDTQCADGYYCSASGECTEQKEQGATCDDIADCQVEGCSVCNTGQCVDDYCCDTTCTGSCSACDGAERDWPDAENGTCGIAPNGFVGDPSCGSFACDGATPTCPGSEATCNADADCSPDHYCNADQECQPRRDAGAACDLTEGEDCLEEGCRVCQTGHCTDGVCCDVACSGGCNACKESLGAEADGVCTVLADGSEGIGCGMFLCDGQNPTCPETGSCLVDGDCSDDSYCTEAGSCAERKEKGETCSTSRECAPADSADEGYCVDGYCCDVACTDGCEACAAALKASGTSDGECGPAKAGTDPHDTCDESPQSSCGETGACDGAGDCQLWPSNTSCGATFCTLENVTGQVCNGVGDCVDVTDLPCAPYLCRNDACTSPCETSQECTADHFCSAAGVCAPGADAGTPCTDGQECSTGFCVDGVCCNSECSGQCEACAFPGSLGSCIAISGEPFAPRPACAGEPPCQGSCDGGDRTSCSYPDEATSCSEPNCEGDVLHQGARCDGAGQCAKAATQNCIPYGCNSDSGECRDQCSIDAECATGARCDEESEKCTSEGNQCSDAFTIESPSGELTSCAPYKCDAGACQQQCTRDSDCQEGHGCDDSRCVELDSDPAVATGSGGSAAGASGDGPDAKSSGDGGCSCRTAHAGGGTAAWWLVASVGLGLVRRRRLVQHPAR